MTKLLHKELSDQVLGAVFKVHNYLGPGLVESAYENLLHDPLFRRASVC